MIAENGFGYEDVFEDGTVHDDYRISYISQHIQAVGETPYGELFLYSNVTP